MDHSSTRASSSTLAEISCNVEPKSREPFYRFRGLGSNSVLATQRQWERFIL